MNNQINPIRDAYNRVVDFIVEHECEACKRRKARLKKGIKAVDKGFRDLLRRPRRK